MPNHNCLRKLLNIALIFGIISFLIKKFLDISSIHEYMQNLIIPIIKLIINYAFEERLNTNSNRNDSGEMQENINRDNPPNNRAISQGNILSGDNSNNLAFERSEEEQNLSGDDNEKKSLKKFGNINENYS